MYSQGWSPREYIKLHKGYKSPLLLDTCMKKNGILMHSYNQRIAEMLQTNCFASYQSIAKYQYVVYYVYRLTLSCMLLQTNNTNRALIPCAALFAETLNVDCALFWNKSATCTINNSRKYWNRGVVLFNNLDREQKTCFSQLFICSCLWSGCKVGVSYYISFVTCTL